MGESSLNSIAPRISRKIMENPEIAHFGKMFGGIRQQIWQFYTDDSCKRGGTKIKQTSVFGLWPKWNQSKGSGGRSIAQLDMNANLIQQKGNFIKMKGGFIEMNSEFAKMNSNFMLNVNNGNQPTLKRACQQWVDLKTANFRNASEQITKQQLHF